MSNGPLVAEELRLLDRYWRAANYLSVGQIPCWQTALATRFESCARTDSSGSDLATSTGRAIAA